MLFYSSGIRGGYGICVIEFENEDNQSPERQDK